VTPGPNFDALALHYRWIEAATFGPLLQWCRTALLPQMLTAQRALVLGDGNGRFLAELLAANSSVGVDAIDISPAMVKLARQRIAANERVRFHIADARLASFPLGSYDLIVTNFFLDCFGPHDLERLIPSLAATLEPGGRWVVGDFRLPARGWPRIAGRAALAAMYAFFQLTTRLPARQLVDPSPFLRSAGLSLDSEKSRLGGFLSARLWVKP
jgi:SAM-dependent methyltransferase